MTATILRCGGRLFQRFMHTFAKGIQKPTVNSTTAPLCGLLFSPDLVLAKLPYGSASVP